MDIKSKVMEVTFRPLTEKEYYEHSERLNELWEDFVNFPSDLPVRPFSDNNEENSALYKHISEVVNNSRIKFFFYTLKDKYNRFDIFVCQLHHSHAGKLLPLISWTELKLSKFEQSKKQPKMETHPLFPPHAQHI